MNIDKFNWINLLELDDKIGIWSMYGVQSNGGLIVLVDAAGKILAVDPTADEVAQQLASLD